MPKDTPSTAKNKIKRCLSSILDPHPGPEDVARLWEHFKSSCAYCGAALEQNSRQGHLDHAVPAALGGTNSIYNHVLACGRCNGDEKREESWETFLAKKCSSPDILNSRRGRIVEWMMMRDVNRRVVDPNTQRRAQAVIDEALASFDKAVSEMRRLKNS